MAVSSHAAAQLCAWEAGSRVGSRDVGSRKPGTSLYCWLTGPINIDFGIAASTRICTLKSLPEGDAHLKSRLHISIEVACGVSNNGSIRKEAVGQFQALPANV